ncbi:MAG: leucyl/phenylalanyl-tRNA--protein transferase [Candidatus Sedimenticola endophacoides]
MLRVLDHTPPETPFPPLEEALDEPNGLLAVGGDLSPARLLNAYRHGIFPWFSQGQPILWWSPAPRMVLYPEHLRISRSLRKFLNRGEVSVTLDHDFGAVIRACAAPRAGDPGTWITPPMQAAYQHLHTLGHAHSAEVWHQGALVGGLYGVAIGGIFFGESMFSRRSNASKAALVSLCRFLSGHGFAMIDCQLHTHHLQSLGAEEIPRARFAEALERHCPAGTLPPGSWRDGTGAP